MPIESVRLRPGINADLTGTLNEGGWSASNLIRWKEGMPQKIGGWQKYWNASIGSAIRALHAWRDFNAVDHLAVGAASTLGVLTSDALSDITPQTVTSNNVPHLSTTSGSSVVTITDSNIANVTTYDTIYFSTPVSIGGLILSGACPITLVTGTTSYEITASSAATSTVGRATITGATAANPCVITANTHGYANGQLVFIDGIVGMTELNDRIFTVANQTANTFELSGIDSTAYTAWSSGGYVYGGIVPQFTTSAGSPIVSVKLPDHGLAVGDQVTFPVSTTISDVVISGTYTVLAVSSSSVFTITADIEAAATATTINNSGQIRLTYYINLAPAATGVGYGLGTYGTGTYGLGVAQTAQTGKPITTTNWTLDNWGKTILSCPEGGGIYAWDPDGGFTNAQLVSTDKAPLFNAGIFVAQPAQILVAYGSTIPGLTGIGVYQDPLLIRWSNQDDYTNWSIDTTNQVGSQRIPRGSKIVSGLQGPNQALIWTDIALWSMQYIGPPLVFSTNEVAAGCGLIAKHARVILGGSVYWMGSTNFFKFAGGVSVIPCTVWDVVFQDLDTAYASKCWAWANSLHNEVWFFYPSLEDGTHECSRYVKLNTLETVNGMPVWDYGSMARSAGIDQSVVDEPLSATSAGVIFQHETDSNGDGQAINAYVESGDFMIADGSIAAFVDRWWPDMKWGPYLGDDSAVVKVTFTATNDMTDTVVVDGPHTLTVSTKFVIPRFRGHRVRIKIESDDVGPLWRLGRNRYRAAPDGKG